MRSAREEIRNENMDRIKLAHDTIHWQALVSIVKKVSFHKMWETP
jgi:hypothetical protein